MKSKILLMCFFVLTYSLVFAQEEQGSFQDELLDKLTGCWIMTGEIAGQDIVHDVDVEWILEHQYLQIKELSREKDEDGTAAYESLVLIGWDPGLKKYSCLWLDVTGGYALRDGAFGHAEREGDKIPFVFKMGDGYFHNTFVYDRESDTWRWILDGEKDGKLNPFARVMLNRKN